MRTYLVEVTAGAHSWTVTDEDAPDYGLADPLIVSWALPDGQNRPNQPDPMVVTFNLVAETAADYDDLVLGDPVEVAVTFGAVVKPEPDVYFTGRIAQGNVKPHARGMLYQFTCADGTADLARYDIGADPYPVQSAADRLEAMWAKANPGSALDRDPVTAIDPDLQVETIEQPAAAQLLTSLIALGDDVALAGLAELEPVNYRPIIAPFPGGWCLDAVPDAYVPSATAPLPAVFVDTFAEPKPYGLVIDADDRAAGVIDACVVDFDSDWAALQPSLATRAAVTWLVASNPDPTVEGAERVNEVRYTEDPPPAGRPPITATRETLTFSLPAFGDPPSYLAAEANALRLGDMMVPAPQNPAGWAPDTFRWLLYKDDIGLADFPVLFPRHDLDVGDPVRTAAYVRPIVVQGIPGVWNAADAGRDWIGGQLASVNLTIQDGAPVVEFQLTPTLPAQGNPLEDPAGMSWDATPGTWDAAPETWDDLPSMAAFRWSDAALTPDVTWGRVQPQSWNMYRLARGS